MPLDTLAIKPRVFVLPLGDYISKSSSWIYGMDCIAEINLETSLYSTGYDVPKLKMPPKKEDNPEKRTLWQRLSSFLHSENSRIEELAQEEDKHYYFEFNTQTAAQAFAEMINSEFQYRAVVQEG